MRAFVAYDRNGNIGALAICPPDGPALFPAPEAGEQIAEVDLAEDIVDLDSEQRTIETLKGFRVDVTVSAARLVRKTSE